MKKFVLNSVWIALIVPLQAIAETSLDRCQPSGHSRLWAQTVIATDLAQDLLKINKIARVSKIAVVDSGFDKNRLSNIDLTGGLTVIPIGNGAKNDVFDRDGHGTRVTSLIKGSAGIGGSVTSPTTVYARSSLELNGEKTIQVLLKACRDGANIINVSIGMSGFIESFVQVPWSVQADESTNAEFRRRGCILVHSAGNSSAKRSYEAADFEFEVAATDPVGKDARFSSRGEFQMPGHLVNTHHSSAHTLSPGDLSCREPNESLVSGTSFAAPLFAAHMALVRDVLMTTKVFRDFDFEHQLKILREISRTAKVGNIVNSYLAVQIAFQWTKHPDKDVQYATRKQQEIACSHSAERRMRAKAILCQDEELRLQLAGQLEAQGDLEGAAYWTNAVQTDRQNQKIARPYPIQALRTDLTQNLSLPTISRWIDFQNWRDARISNSDSRPVKALNAAVKKVLNDLEASSPQFRSSTFTGQLNDLVLFAVKHGRDDAFFANLVSKLKANKEAQQNLVRFLVRGSNEKVLNDADLDHAMGILLSQRSTKIELFSVAQIIRYADLSFNLQFKYLKQILQHPEAYGGLFAEFTLVGLIGDKPSPASIENWLSVLNFLLDHPLCGPAEADDLSVTLFAAEETLLQIDSAVVERLLAKFTEKFADQPVQKGRHMVDFLRKKMKEVK